MYKIEPLPIDYINSDKELPSVVWYAASSIINVGYKGDEFNKIEENSFGSHDGIFGEQDVYRFSKQSKELYLLRLKCSPNIKVLDEACVEVNEQPRIILAQKIQDFGIESCAGMEYFQTSDTLFGKYTNIELSSTETQALLIGKNLFLIFEELQLVGWLLTNASSMLISNETPEIVAKYLSFCNDEMYELMEDEDEHIKSELIKFREHIKAQLSLEDSEIIRGLNGLLEGYYA